MGKCRHCGTEITMTNIQFHESKKCLKGVHHEKNR